MERSLVTIRKVSRIENIPDADNIEIAHIDGWQCVVKKGQFSSGDLGVYFEIDSYLPIEPRFEFLRKGSYKKLPELESRRHEGFRLRTVKLRGALSQGLLMPLSDFPELNGAEERTDVTQLLNVVLYEPPIDASLRGKVKGFVPSVIRKTNQERIQNFPEYLTTYKDELYEVTEKIDGTSMTVYYYQGTFGVCGHNMEFYLDSDSNTSYVEVAKDLGIEPALRKMGRNIAIQGELSGEGIQGNPLKFKGHRFFIFDIWDIDQQRYMTKQERDALLGTIGLKLDHVPVIALAPLRQFNTIDEILKFADGTSLINTSMKREGLVFKPSNNHRIPSFKVISNKYLLKTSA